MSEIQATECATGPNLPVGSEKVGFGTLFCFSPNVWQSVGESAFRDLCGENQNEKDLLISGEGAFGGLVSPQPWMVESASKYGEYMELERALSIQSDVYSLTSHLEKLQSLSSKFGYRDLKVLFTIRRQDTKLASEYAEVSDKVRGASQENFEEWARYLVNDPLGYGASGGAKMDYFEWWKKISAVIGKNNIFVIPFELLKKDIREFLRMWLGYINVSEKEEIIHSILGKGGETHRNKRSTSKFTWSLSEPIKGPSNISIPAGRFLTALGLPFRVPLRWPDFSREEEIRLSDKLSDEILIAYEKSNRLLDESLPHLSLKRYDYF
ncbi:hypothetical protein GGQ11_002761 [Salinibacter ruber]|nr:hypothetical protein [Salinibacter ruber]MCS3657960.1 hypothetical protein [Salinibacter ruber]MCS4169883.1 hypothetical protein [Salinibacter ruber]